MESLGLTANIAIARLPHGADLPLPDYHSADAAGMDLRAAVTDPITLAPLQRMAVPCGFAMALPPGFEAQIRPRSGLALKHGISMPNSPGTIDADYRGEIQALLINLGTEGFTITRGMRIAQMVIAPVAKATWVETDHTDKLPSSGRGTSGFGSTGH
jgi:dUTP pyrophosphatase